MTATWTSITTVVAYPGESMTVIPMDADELAALTEDIDSLGLPETGHGLALLRGWKVFDRRGQYIGRLFSRNTVMTAEWYDSVDQNDWVLAEWDCHRIERGVYQIAIMRDEVRRLVGLAA